MLAGAAAVAASAPLAFAPSARSATTWDYWDHLVNHQPDATTLNNIRAARGREALAFAVQRIDDATGEHVNFDFFGVRILQMPTTGPNQPATLFNHVRQNLGRFLDQAYSSFRGYTDHEYGDWHNSLVAPLGTMMIFDIPAGVLGMHEQAGVVTSAATEFSWVFTTVTFGSAMPGEHPVSGNREFGLFQDATSIVIFTRAADRVMASTLPGEPTVLAGADNLWTSFQSNLAFYVNSTGGRAEIMVPTRERPLWSDVVASGLVRR
jgi:hypothetical protein